MRCIMKRIIYLGIILSVLMLFACGKASVEDVAKEYVRRAVDGTIQNKFRDGHIRFMAKLDYSLGGATYISDNIIKVNMYMSSFKVSHITQQAAYNPWTLLSDIGGILGLYLGATVSTVLEFIVFCTDLHNKSPGVNRL